MPKKRIKTTDKKAEIPRLKDLTETSYQNNATNKIILANEKRGTLVSSDFGNKRISFDDLTVSIPEEFTLNVATGQMMQYLLTLYYNEPNHENKSRISFTLKEYMKTFGKKDRKSAISYVRQRLSAISSARFSYSSKNDKNPFNQSFGEHSFIEGFDYKNGVFTVTYSQFFTETLSQQLMQITTYKITYRLNPKNQQAEFYILKAFETNKRNNLFNNPDRADKMRIETLLPYIKNLPTYEEVKAGNRNYTERIIEPVFKAMETLTSDINGAFLEYHFFDADGQPMDYMNLTYQEFLKGYIRVKWNDYPVIDRKHKK